MSLHFLSFFFYFVHISFCFYYLFNYFFKKIFFLFFLLFIFYIFLFLYKTKQIEILIFGWGGKELRTARFASKGKGGCVFWMRGAGGSDGGWEKVRLGMGNRRGNGGVDNEV